MSQALSLIIERERVYTREVPVATLPVCSNALHWEKTEGREGGGLFGEGVFG